MNRILINLLILCGLICCQKGKATDPVPPTLFVQNYSVGDYNASCQNWDVAISYWGTLYVANNSGLLSFDGNSWICHQTPEKSPILQVTISHDTIYTKEEHQYAYWLYDELGSIQYHAIDHIPAHVQFDHPEVSCPIPDTIQADKPSVICTNRNLYFVGTQRNGIYILDKTGHLLLHLNQSNLLQDNIVRNMVVQDTSRIWVVFDNGISQIDIDPPFMMLGKRSKIGKLVNAALHNDSIYIQTNLGYYKRSLDTQDTFLQISKEEVQQRLFSSNYPKGYPVHQLLKEHSELGGFAEAEDIYPTHQPGFYWLIKHNQAALTEENNGKWSIKCRLMLKNYNMHMVTNGTKLFSLNDTFCIVSTMQGPLLVNTHGLISSGLGSLTQSHFRRIEYIDDHGLHLISPDVSQITLPHHFKEIRLNVSTTIFTPNHQISYLLEGVSTDWSDWQRDGKISFLQLPTGQYKLRVRKYVVRGPFPELTIDIEVRPAWYKTIWAYLLYILLALFLLHRTIQHNLQQQQKKLKEQQENERHQEAQRLQQLEHERLENELQNKNNELTLQTSALVRRNQSIQSFLDELEKQKETLGDRYPNKLYNRLRGLMEEALNDQADWLQFETYFNSAHQNFIDRLRQQYTDLTSGDLRICCLLRMNLSTKEIASLLNISVRAIELRRYRLRKRLNLDNDTNLVNFLSNF
ncbi:MAG: transcriptional regulator [Parabacteroides sp.]